MANGRPAPALAPDLVRQSVMLARTQTPFEQAAVPLAAQAGAAAQQTASADGSSVVATSEGRIVVQPFSWRWYFDTARRCKLYDFERRCWTDYAGTPTSPSA